MAKPKAPQHISKPLTKKAYLPPLQKKVFLHLANNNPKNINETAKDLKSHYKSTWTAFKQLENKNLIKPVNNKNFQVQKYPQYWLTADGAFIALCEGAKANSLIRRAFEIYPNDEDLQYLLETTSILGTEAFKIGYLAFVSKGKLEQSDIAQMLITQVMNGLSPDQISQFNKVLQKYPERLEGYDKLLDKMSDSLGELGKLFSESTPKKGKFSMFRKKKNKI